jgi:hypothetical protein
VSVILQWRYVHSATGTVYVTISKVTCPALREELVLCNRLNHGPPFVAVPVSMFLAEYKAIA